MTENTQNDHDTPSELGGFLAETKKIFALQYAQTKHLSVLTARNSLEALVEQGEITPADALALIKNPTSLKQFLDLEKEAYDKNLNQEVHGRLAALERNTHIGYAIGISIATGLTFCVAGPFASAWLQPTADSLFKPQPAAQNNNTPQSTPPSSVTNNFTFNFNLQPRIDLIKPEAPQTDDRNKNQPKVSCKNVSISGYTASLLELLQRGNTVTIDMNGKKITLCYRPARQSSLQQQTLAK